MKLFDSHSHIDDKSYNSDLDNVIENAHKAGLKAIMVVGITEQSSNKAVKLAKNYKGIYASVGMHPHEVKECSDDVLKRLQTLSLQPEVKAWGEIGLDFNRMFSPRDVQEKWFIEQINMADDLNLPIIFHERDSQGRFLEILSKSHKKGRQGVIHCFSGNIDEMKSYIDLGYHIGITGILTIKGRGKSLRKIVPYIPIDRILIETDAPYLTPAPEKNRTRRNEPAFVKSVLLKLAQVRGLDPEYLANKIWDNTCKLFNIKD